MAVITSNNAARLQNNIQKPLNKIKDLIKGAETEGAIATFYDEKLLEQIEKIQSVLDNMEY